jgi:exopolysaccharide biosynthesis WecB/TagA/CpsF family protein
MTAAMRRHAEQVRLRVQDRRVIVMGVPIDVMSGDEVLKLLSQLTHEQVAHVAYANAHTLNLAYRDSEYRDVLGRCALILNDGVGLSIAARLRRRAFVENLNGTDFTTRLLEMAASLQWRVFLLGGKPGVAESAKQLLESAIPGLSIVGVLTGYEARAHSDVAAAVRNSGADMMVVALGQPLQEFWLDHHLIETGCRLGVGVGAFLDFASGGTERAPKWMRACSLEWLFRLIHEPRRLGRRYVLGNPLFVLRAWRLRGADMTEIADRTEPIGAQELDNT